MMKDAAKALSLSRGDALLLFIGKNSVRAVTSRVD